MSKCTCTESEYFDYHMRPFNKLNRTCEIHYLKPIKKRIHFVYTQKEIEFLIKNQNLLIDELTDLFNKSFKKRNQTSIRNKMDYMEKQGYIVREKITHQHNRFIRENINMPSKKLVELFNEKFGTNRKVSYIYCKKTKLRQ